jgi:hypothetical protein
LLPKPTLYRSALESLNLPSDLAHLESVLQCSAASQLILHSLIHLFVGLADVPAGATVSVAAVLVRAIGDVGLAKWLESGDVATAFLDLCLGAACWQC